MKIITSITLICLFTMSCDDKNCYIKDVYVNEIIPLDLYPELITPGRSVFVDGGVDGIIIYHVFGNEYKIYYRNCSYEPCLSCSVIDTVNSGIAWCGCCPSAFNINNSGESINAPALLPLKQYKWSLDENNTLRIFN